MTFRDTLIAEFDAVGAGVLKRYFRADETTGTVATDETGQGNGTWVGATLGQTSLLPSGEGLSATVDGVDDYLNTGFTADLVRYTIIVVCKSPNAPNGNAQEIIAGRSDNWQLNWDHGQAAYQGWFEHRNGAGTWQGVSVGTLLANTVYMFASTYDGTNIRAYKGAFADGAGTFALNASAAAAAPRATTAAAQFGAQGALKFFPGSIDEMAFGSEALSLAALQRIFDSGFTTTPTEIQTLAPDAILAMSGLTGTVSAIQDDPATPDANWLTA